MKTIRSLAVVLALAWCAAVGISVVAEERAGEPRPKDEKQAGKPQAGKPAAAPAEPVRVYTNDDLDRLPTDPAARRRPDSAAAGTARPGKAEEKPAGQLQDPLKQLEDEQARSAGIDAQIKAAEQRLASAEARVKALERRALAIENPYLPRPEVPPEQAEEWKKMDGVARVKATEAELKQARAEADDAKATLEKLRAAAGVR